MGTLAVVSAGSKEYWVNRQAFELMRDDRWRE